MTTITPSSEISSNYGNVLPFGFTTAFASSDSESTVLSFSSSTIVSSSSTTTTTSNAITLDIFETNDGAVPLTDPIVTSDSPFCDPEFVGGDVNNNGILDPDEQWHYTCNVVSENTGIFEIILTGFGTAPDNTIITWPGDPDERITATVVVVLDADNPRDMKQNVKDQLSTLEVNDRQDQKRINRADKVIGKSLEDRFWQDDFTLTKFGKKVFDEDKKAVKTLSKITSADASVIIKMLVDTDQTLAQIAIDSIPTDTGNNKVDRALANANKEMKKAIQKLETEKPEKAINHFKKAWMHAQKAMYSFGEDDKHDGKGDKHHNRDGYKDRDGMNKDWKNKNHDKDFHD